MKTLERLNEYTRNIETCTSLGWVVAIDYVSEGSSILEWLYSNKKELTKYGERPKIFKTKESAERFCKKIQHTREEKVYCREYFHWSYRRATIDELKANDESKKSNQNN